MPLKINPLTGQFDLVGTGGGGGGTVDASQVTYTPSTPGNWSTVPDDAAEALDELASRPNLLVDRFKQVHASLSAFDKVQSVTYADAGQAYERIATVTYSSSTYPDVSMTKTVTWLDAGTMKQRVEKEELVATALSPDSLRKTYLYTLVGIRYRKTGFTLETF